jgi:hypothetical protein
MATLRPAGRPQSRRRIRTWALSLGALAVLGAAVLLVLFKSLSPPEPAPSGASNTPGASSPDGIAGTVTVAKELERQLPEDAVLFVIARKAAAGPPFAVVRIPQPTFPQSFRLGPDNVMMAGTPFEGSVHLAARLSRTGTAGPAQPGDLEGETPGLIPIGTANVTLALSRVR